jgi:colanic acid biosynthesis glycosyl transferase WcaI
VLFVSHFFPPEELSAAFLTFEFARALVEAGHQVDVLTGFPNWPAGASFAGYASSRFTRELMSGINVHRVPFFPSPNGNFLQRALDFKSFQLLAWHFGRKLPRPDLVYVMVPPNEDALVARRLALHFGAAYVPNIQDIQPDTAIALGYLRNPVVIALLRRQEAAVYRDADRVVAIGESMRRRLINKGVDAKLIEVLPNWINPQDVIPLPRENSLRSEWNIAPGRFVVLYAGTFGRIHNVPIMLQVANGLRDTPALLLLVGQGYDFEKVRTASAEGTSSNIQVKPFVPRDRLSEMQSLSDLSVVLVRRGYGHTSVPSKILGYMSAGRPVLGAVDADCDTAAAITEADCGELVEPDSVTELTRSIRIAMTDPARLARQGRNARRFIEEKLSATVVLGRGVSLLENIVAERQHGKRP